MADYNWKHLKSGTDIRGVAVDGVEGEPLDLTDEVIEKMAGGFASWLSGYYDKPIHDLTIAVGHDSRISAQRIKSAVMKSLMGRGVKVIDCALASTPAMFMTTQLLGCDGSIQITASHHPYHRNGLKFFISDGGLNAEDIDVILEAAENDHIPEGEQGTSAEYNFMAIYAEKLRDMICTGVQAEEYEKPLKGFKIIVDAGNGVGGFYAYDVLKPLGADIEGSQFLEPDGMFPNHIPNPENKTAMDAIQRATVESGADLGIIFDTDVDRAGCVDSAGKEINRNRLAALASVIALEGNEGGTIVTDSITSDGFKKFIEEDLKAHHHRFKRGYKNVINESIKLNDEGINSPLAIETSGHAAFRENYFLDDGAYLITKIIIKMANLRKEGKTIDDLIANLTEALEETEIRLGITASDFKAYGNSVIERLEQEGEKKGWNIAQDSQEGIRVSFDQEQGDGWFLLRLSVHDPIMPLNIESNRSGGVYQIARKLYQELKQFNLLDLSSYEKYLEEHDDKAC